MSDDRAGKASRRFHGWNPVHAGLETRTLLSGIGSEPFVASAVSVPIPVDLAMPARPTDLTPAYRGLFDLNVNQPDAWHTTPVGSTYGSSEFRVMLAAWSDLGWMNAMPLSTLSPADLQGDPSGGNSSLNSPAYRTNGDMGGPGARFVEPRFHDLTNLSGLLDAALSEIDTTATDASSATPTVVTAGETAFVVADPTPVLQATQHFDHSTIVHGAFLPVENQPDLVGPSIDPIEAVAEPEVPAVEVVENVPIDEAQPPTEVPTPIGSDLSLSALPFDSEVWDAAVGRLVLGVEDLLSSLDNPETDAAYLPWVLAAGVALTASEAARRRRSKQSFAMAMVDGSVVEPDGRDRGRSIG